MKIREARDIAFHIFRQLLEHCADGAVRRAFTQSIRSSPCSRIETVIGDQHLVGQPLPGHAPCDGTHLIYGVLVADVVLA